ncbi:hypothetical protein C0Q70_07963 [Pomacea canaliculata]|uniref:Uncharacterized protein n=1 Tax=Pomacea canaliculata TaxID=400727 RepID=A0A2T7PGI0_POMCA|nr:hypothetical protein C0Q70_07963 [Pomacea canaliculata]
MLARKLPLMTSLDRYNHPITLPPHVTSTTTTTTSAPTLIVVPRTETRTTNISSNMRSFIGYLQQCSQLEPGFANCTQDKLDAMQDYVSSATFRFNDYPTFCADRDRFDVDSANFKFSQCLELTKNLTNGLPRDEMCSSLAECYVSSLAECYVSSLTEYYVSGLNEYYASSLAECYVSSLAECYVSGLARQFVMKLELISTSAFGNDDYDLPACGSHVRHVTSMILSLTLLGRQPLHGGVPTMQRFSRPDGSSRALRVSAPATSIS